MPHSAAHELAARLQSWLDEPLNRRTLAAARDDFDALAEIVQRDASERLHAVALTHIFIRTGYARDYRKLASIAKRTRMQELLECVDDVARAELPDEWIKRRLKLGESAAALDGWFEFEDHTRAHLAADAVLKAAPDRTDVLVSTRLAKAGHLIRRGTRRRYRRACKILRMLRDELERRNELDTWWVVIELVAQRYSRRPALLDELREERLLGPEEVE